jgi:hypothetical protein
MNYDVGEEILKKKNCYICYIMCHSLRAGYREKLIILQDELDTMQGLQNQEIAKVKHLVSMEVGLESPAYVHVQTADVFLFPRLSVDPKRKRVCWFRGTMQRASTVVG